MICWERDKVPTPPLAPARCLLQPLTAAEPIRGWSLAPHGSEGLCRCHSQGQAPSRFPALVGQPRSCKCQHKPHLILDSSLQLVAFREKIASEQRKDD